MHLSMDEKQLIVYESTSTNGKKAVILIDIDSL